MGRAQAQPTQMVAAEVREGMFWGNMVKIHRRIEAVKQMMAQFANQKSTEISHAAP